MICQSTHRVSATGDRRRAELSRECRSGCGYSGDGGGGGARGSVGVPRAGRGRGVSPHRPAQRAGSEVRARR